jgi:hypothetical protein
LALDLAFALTRWDFRFAMAQKCRVDGIIS